MGTLVKINQTAGAKGSGRLVKISEKNDPVQPAALPKYQSRRETGTARPQIAPSSGKKDDGYRPSNALVQSAYDGLREGALPAATQFGRLDLPTGAAAERKGQRQTPQKIQREETAQRLDDLRRQELEAERRQLTLPGRVYNEETTAQNRARVQEIDRELDGLRPSSRYNPLMSAAGAVQKGLGQVAQFGGDTLAMAEDAVYAPFELVSGLKLGDLSDEGFFNRWAADIRRENEGVAQFYQRNMELGGKPAEILEGLGASAVAAAPQAALALVTGGGSLGVQTASGLARTAAAELRPGLGTTVGNAVDAMAKNPQFWTAFAQVVGGGYEEAIQDQRDRGETDENLIRTKAALYAVGNGLLNAAVEMGGGIQTLPAQLQGGKSAWRAWVEGMVDEGKEEVVQGILQRSLQNAIYQQDNPLFSTTDEGAILNPKTAAEEFAGGAAVGGILGGGQALILSRRAARPTEEYLTEREGILRDLATQKVQGEMELARRRAAPRELIRPETARELLATLGERGERAFRAAYQQESGLLPSFREFAKAYNQGLRGEPETAVEPGRSIDTMAGYFAGQNDAAAQSAARLQTQKTAPTGEAGTYRAVRPQNVELPTVPIISLSMQDVADMNGGVLPQTGNALRKEAITRARKRLGLDQNSAVYIPASNVMRNGEEYILKITRASLNKMLSPSGGNAVPPESIVVLDNIERIANNGVWFEGQGDRKGRQQVNGIDHLKTTVYIDNVPYEVDMRVRLIQQNARSPQENVLYYFTPEEIVTIEKVGTNPPTGERRALTGASEGVPTSDASISKSIGKVNPESGGQIDEPAAVEPGRSIDTMAGYFAGQNDAAAQSAARVQTQKTAPTGRAEISDYQKEEHHGEILDTVRAHLSDVSSLSPVAALTGQEFQKTATDSRSLRVRVIEFFNSIGNKVTRKDLGDIALNTSGVRDSLGHGYGKLKAVTFAALPQVLEQGKIIAHNGPYEGHGYDSYIISAPVRIGSETAYVGALVIKDAKQRYKLHEVLMASQSGASLFQTETTSQGAGGPLRNDAPLGAPGGAPTPKSIAQIGGRDNSKIPQVGRSDALGVPEQDAAMGAKEALLTVGRRMTEAERAELEALHAREDSLTREEKARYRELLSRRIEEALYWGGTEP